MQSTPQLQLLIETIRGLCRAEGQALDNVATLLWLMTSSEDCQRTLETAAPSRENLEKLCEQVGDPVRAWVQFSPRACDLLSRPE